MFGIIFGIEFILIFIRRIFVTSMNVFANSCLQTDQTVQLADNYSRLAIPSSEQTTSQLKIATTIRRLQHASQPMCTKLKLSIGLCSCVRVYIVCGVCVCVCVCVFGVWCMCVCVCVCVFVWFWGQRCKMCMVPVLGISLQPTSWYPLSAQIEQGQAMLLLLKATAQLEGNETQLDSIDNGYISQLGL